MLSTEAGSGGAARAMQRLVRGLRGRGHAVDVLSREASPDGSGVQVARREGDPVADRFAEDCASALDEMYVAARRTAVSNTGFSTQISGFDLAADPAMRTYDVLNVHWTGGMMSPMVLGNLIDLGMPTVFTLHDMAHFTGGCHYSAGCAGFEGACEPCHQVQPDELGLIRHSLEAKRRRYGKRNVRAVAPSAWMAGRADASKVFDAPALAIPNAVEPDIFRLRDRAPIRQSLGLAPGAFAILFGVYDNAERRKGFEHLIGVLDRCLAMPAFAARAREDRIRVITFGKSSAELEATGIPLLELGWIGDDKRLSEIYNAADLCVLPSSEDNQPNVMLEAMACGTPVVAFQVGGIPETIADGRTGRLIEPFDLDAMAAAISDLLSDRERTSQLGQEAARAAQELTLDRQARGYEDVFAQLLADTGWRSSASDAAPPEKTRRIEVPFVLDPVLEAKPVAPVLAGQIRLLADELAAVKENRAVIHDQLVSISHQLAALQRRDAEEQAWLRRNPVNRVLLKLLAVQLRRRSART